MCIEVLVKRGDERIVCTSVGELARALGKRLIEVSPVEEEDCCLCGIRRDELNLREATEDEGAPFTDFVIEL